MPSSKATAAAAALHSDGRRGGGGGGYLIALDRPALIDGKFMARVQALADGALSFIPSVTRGAEQRTETPPSHIRRRRSALRSEIMRDMKKSSAPRLPSFFEPKEENIVITGIFVPKLR